MNRFDIVRYTRGFGLQIGGEEKLFPHFLGATTDKIELFADGALDFIVSYEPMERPKQLKDSGFLITEDGVSTAAGPVKTMRAEKTAAVVRYGGIGDMIQAASVWAQLKAQGYHVTVYTWPMGQDVVRHDPNIDEFYIQDRDQVPNDLLGDFWAREQTKYDKWVNLCEVMERTLLTIPKTIPDTWPQALRHQMCNRNYLEFAHDVAEIPHKFNARFYPTEDERAWARVERRKIGPSICWSQAGSSVHKIWPHMDVIIARALLTYPDMRIVLMGSKDEQYLETPWQGEPRVICRSGVWSVRQSLSYLEQADLVIGTETGVLNAAGMLDVPKVIFLSHSSRENLTKHWRNTFALTSDAPCSPCHRLLYGFDRCVKDEETGTALCAARITPDMAWQAITRCLGQNRKSA